MRPVRLHTRSFIFAAASLAVMGSWNSAWAQEVSLPSGAAADTTAPAPVTIPARGTTKSKVEAQFGAPTERHTAIGQPPITRWDYPGFSVFFEYEHVIHSVLR